MNKWLQDFAYRITISWWVFAVAGIGALLIALLTVSFQAIKAAGSKPCKEFENGMMNVSHQLSIVNKSYIINQVLC